MEVIALTRKFIAKISGEEREFADPNPDYTPEQVMEHYSVTNPELTTATVEKNPNIESDQMIYTFKTTVGTKG